MAVLQLQVDISSDVHPELHAMLASIGDGAAQAERLRQLAAAGLIWEHLRAHVHSGVAVGLPVAAAAREGGTDRSQEPSVALPPRPATEKESGGSNVAAGVGDMTIGELPILHDAIEAKDSHRPASAAAKKAASCPSGGRRSESLQAGLRNKAPPAEVVGNAKPAALAAQPGEACDSKQEIIRLARSTTSERPKDDIDPDADVDDLDDYSPPVRKSGTRSRLLRMKEKGLFSNGPDC